MKPLTYSKEDFRVVDGVLIHERWLNPDGTRKTGVELEKEELLVQIQCVASRLMELCRDQGSTA